MPHLDAKALVEDPDGMEFLKGVLETPAEMPPMRREMSSARTAHGRAVSSGPEAEINRPRRPAPVSEAA